MKKILVPTDFSKNAYAALIYVSKLYEGASEITLLHSFSNEVDKLTSRVEIARTDAIIEELYRQSEEDGKQLLQQLENDLIKKTHKYEVISTPAPLSKVINKLVETEAIDLVVMGSKGRTAAEDILVGSTTITITKNLQGCPLLIVPNDVDFVVPLNIAFATDFNEFHQLSKLKPITRLVRKYNSKIHILHVGNEGGLNTNQRQHMEHFLDDLSEYDVEIHFIPKKVSISKSIHKFMDDNYIDILSLVYHKHAFIKQLFREPVVNRVGKHEHKPTMVIPAKN